LLTLEPALPGQHRDEMLHRLLHDDPRTPRSLNPGIPVDLETVGLKALRKEPRERYATAQELADDPPRFLDRRPVLARRPAARERRRAWDRRHAAGLTAALVALLVSTVALAVATVVAVRAYREAARKQAEAEQQHEFGRQAIDEMYTAVAVEWLEDQASLGP